LFLPIRSQPSLSESNEVINQLRSVHSCPSLTHTLPTTVLEHEQASPSNPRPRSPTPNRAQATVSDPWDDLNSYAATFVDEVIQFSVWHVQSSSELHSAASPASDSFPLPSSPPQPASSASSASELKWTQSYSSSPSMDLLSSTRNQPDTCATEERASSWNCELIQLAQQIVDEVLDLAMTECIQDTEKSSLSVGSAATDTQVLATSENTEPTSEKHMSDEQTRSVPCASNPSTHSLADEAALFSSTLDVCSARCFSEEGYALSVAEPEDDDSPDVDLSTTSTVSLSSYLHLQAMSSEDSGSGSSARPTSPRSVHLFWSRPPSTRCDLSDLVITTEHPCTDATGDRGIAQRDSRHQRRRPRRDRGRHRERHPYTKRASRSLPMEYSFSSSSSGDRLATLDQLVDDDVDDVTGGVKDPYSLGEWQYQTLNFHVLPLTDPQTYLHDHCLDVLPVDRLEEKSIEVRLDSAPLGRSCILIYPLPLLTIIFPGHDYTFGTSLSGHAQYLFHTIQHHTMGNKKDKPHSRRELRITHNNEHREPQEVGWRTTFDPTETSVGG
uniref:Protein RUBCNL-like n=1 Tax=Echinostoma caproni TaxID=27848 RepID=A0A183B9L9_9TREM